MGHRALQSLCEGKQGTERAGSVLICCSGALPPMTPRPLASVSAVGVCMLSGRRLPQWQLPTPGRSGGGEQIDCSREPARGKATTPGAAPEAAKKFRGYKASRERPHMLQRSGCRPLPCPESFRGERSGGIFDEIADSQSRPTIGDADSDTISTASGSLVHSTRDGRNGQARRLPASGGAEGDQGPRLQPKLTVRLQRNGRKQGCLRYQDKNKSPEFLRGSCDRERIPQILLQLALATTTD
jgi:hypothetical protein